MRVLHTLKLFDFSGLGEARILEAGFGDFSEQKIAENRNSLGTPHFFRIYEIRIVSRPLEFRQDSHQILRFPGTKVR